MAQDDVKLSRPEPSESEAIAHLRLCFAKSVRSLRDKAAGPKQSQDQKPEHSAIAIFSLDTHHVSRAVGSSAVAAAAYRAGISLLDQRLGQVFDYTHKSGVLESRMVLPQGVEWAEVNDADARANLWNAAEATERYKTARVAREWRIALPAELSPEARAACAYQFAQEWADRHGVAVDVALHAPSKEGDERNWHAHLLCTTRCLMPGGGLGAKAKIEWSNTARKKAGLKPTTSEIADARQLWADICNDAFVRAGLPDRIDPRSHKERGIDLEPTKHVGAKATARRRKGLDSERADENEATRQENSKAIRREPEKVLAAITSREAVFTRHDMARELNRHIDDPQEFQALLARLEQSTELVQLAPEVRDDAGHVLEQARYSTRAMVRTERGMIDAAQAMQHRRSHDVGRQIVAEAVQRAGTLTDEQRTAVEHILDGHQISAVIGDAGTGKSFSMKVAREAWEAAGYRVIGAALAGKAADGLQEGSGIESRTLHSLEQLWKNGDEQNRLTANTVIVIDEAGMVGSQQLARVIAAAEKAGAKVVLVGDDKQLQAVEAGAPFRAIVERIGAAEITDIRRQNEAWAKTASMALARGEVKDGLDAYQARGHVRMEATRDDARRALVADYLASREAGGSSIVLAHSNADVQALNEAVRAHRRAAGELDEGATFATSKGSREFAAGDRLVFLKNDRALNVKNGMLGTVEQAEAGRLAVRLDNGELREVKQADELAIDHGYAVTVHKSQGVTVDRAFVLASQGMDKHLAYVAMTRHRDAVRLYAGQDDFVSYEAMAARLGREQPKATTLDFDTAAFADRRGFDGLAVVRRMVQRGQQIVERLKDRLDAAAARLASSIEARALPNAPAPKPGPRRVALVVPWLEKDKAKAAGARFDGVDKRWYAPPGADFSMAGLGPWLPKEQERRRAERAARAAQEQERRRRNEQKAQRIAAETAWLAQRVAEPGTDSAPGDAGTCQENTKNPMENPMEAILQKWRRPAQEHPIGAGAERDINNQPQPPSPSADHNHERGHEP